MPELPRHHYTWKYRPSYSAYYVISMYRAIKAAVLYLNDCGTQLGKYERDRVVKMCHILTTPQYCNRWFPTLFCFLWCPFLFSFSFLFTTNVSQRPQLIVKLTGAWYSVPNLYIMSITDSNIWIQQNVEILIFTSQIQLQNQRYFSITFFLSISFSVQKLSTWQKFLFVQASCF